MSTGCPAMLGCFILGSEHPVVQRQDQFGARIRSRSTCRRERNERHCPDPEWEVVCVERSDIDLLCSLSRVVALDALVAHGLVFDHAGERDRPVHARVAPPAIAFSDQPRRSIALPAPSGTGTNGRLRNGRWSCRSRDRGSSADARSSPGGTPADGSSSDRGRGSDSKWLKVSTPRTSVAESVAPTACLR